MGRGSISKSLQKSKEKFKAWNRQSSAKRAKDISRAIKKGGDMASRDVKANFRKNYLNYAAIAKNASAIGSTVGSLKSLGVAGVSTLVGEEGTRMLKRSGHDKLAKVVRIGGRALPYVYEGVRIARMAAVPVLEGGAIAAGDLTMNPVALAATGVLAAGVVSQLGMNMAAAHQRKMEKKHDPKTIAEAQTRDWRRDAFHDMDKQGFKLDKKMSTKQQAVFSNSGGNPIILQREKRNNGDEIWGDISSEHVSKEAQKIIDKTNAKYHTASLGQYGRVVSNNPTYAMDHKKDNPTIDPYTKPIVYKPDPNL